MAEKESLGKKEIQYDGIFSAKELIETIKDTASDKKFSVSEGEHIESVKKTGRYIQRTLTLGKTLSDYAKLKAIISLQFSELKDTIVQKAGKKKKYQTGKLYLTIEPLLVTDYEERWESKPVFFLLRMFFEKNIYSPQLKKFRAEGEELMELLYENLKAYLNLQKY
ncbi:hypothetical protein HYV79_00890 [Candidatus Woesearchaeota archaeon]|nr:hypothetical protein [Candidatus Woesearchaeota archaeon]